MSVSAIPTVGTKGFKTSADVEEYVEAFNKDAFETYFQYYNPDISIDIASIPGEKNLQGYYDWAQGHHQIASETLVPKKIIFDRDSNGKLVMLESWTEFKGRKGVDIDDFFGWGPVAEGIGPIIKMIVFYHLDEQDRIKYLEPACAILKEKATKPARAGRGFRTEEDVHNYIGFFSNNDFASASQFWAPKLRVDLGKATVEGREDNIKFFSAQRASGMNENVAPLDIKILDDRVELKCNVTFTAQKDFPEGYFGMGGETGVKKGQSIKLPFLIIYEVDENRQAKVIKTLRQGEPVIS